MTSIRRPTGVDRWRLFKKRKIGKSVLRGHHATVFGNFCRRSEKQYTCGEWIYRRSLHIRPDLLPLLSEKDGTRWYQSSGPEDIPTLIDLSFAFYQNLISNRVLVCTCVVCRSLSPCVTFAGHILRCYQSLPTQRRIFWHQVMFKIDSGPANSEIPAIDRKSLGLRELFCECYSTYFGGTP